ncbi:MAG: sugar phosphate isomerase/epimerase [Clostridia bacterium]|nr:sugar phosphate isomerase/epimerase [Clostridia bacterium]MDD4679942.1 sugar phosphate isomerase/epimerase [Clostridia bacterium]
MRIGGPILKKYNSPEEWIKLVKGLQYGAVYAPMHYDDPQDLVSAYLEEAKKANVVIAEVGAWSNPISRGEKERKEALNLCKRQLDLADRIGANCCVNITGSTGEIWDGFYKDNYSEDTYALIVDTVRDIIDAVKPKNTFYTLEPMPWMVPDSPDTYLQLLTDVDRKAFGVHLDVVNMINNPYKYLFNREFIQECFQKLGPYIKSCHAKDVIMSNQFTTMIKEAAPGKGTLDYLMFLQQVEALNPDMPVMLEHLETQKEYTEAFNYVKGTADANNIVLR